MIVVVSKFNKRKRSMNNKAKKYGDHKLILNQINGGGKWTSGERGRGNWCNREYALSLSLSVCEAPRGEF